MKKIPLLEANDIECRIQSVSKNKSGKVGAVLLLYKDARVDMRILDQVFGAENWQRTHEVINGNLFCNIDIWDDEKKCWIRKQDVGKESNAEKEKGQASDAFKRAGFNVGVGRELYSAPFVYVELKEDEYYTKKDGNIAASASTKFKVSHIGYNEKREISELLIIDSKGMDRYSLRGSSKGNRAADPTSDATARQAKSPSDEIIELQQMNDLLILSKEKNVPINLIEERYGKKIEHLTKGEWAGAMKSLRATKKKEQGEA